MNLLHIDSSISGEASVSRRLTAWIVRTLEARHPGLRVLRRDLAAQPPAHLSAELFDVVKLGRRDGLNDRQQAEADLVEQLVEELLAADVLVIGAPMYNFTIPTQLKAWIDRVAQPGRTFHYTAEGPEGLAGGRTAIVVSSRGGRYAGTSFEAAMDHQEAYLRAFLGFIGIGDVIFVRAEGTGMGPEALAAALSEAEAQIAGLAVPLAA